MGLTTRTYPDNTHTRGPWIGPGHVAWSEMAIHPQPWCQMLIKSAKVDSGGLPPPSPLPTLLFISGGGGGGVKKTSVIEGETCVCVCVCGDIQTLVKPYVYSQPNFNQDSSLIPLWPSFIRYVIYTITF